MKSGLMVIVQKLKSALPEATHWSLRDIARASGLSLPTIQTVWRVIGLQPHSHIELQNYRRPRFIVNVALPRLKCFPGLTRGLT